MRSWKKAVALIVLGFLEIVFLAWAIAANIPRRSADIEAFMKYRNAPTIENEHLWLKERRITEKEVMLRRSVGTCLGFANLFLIGWVARKGGGPRL